jgi:hypothetical protein
MVTLPTKQKKLLMTEFNRNINHAWAWECELSNGIRLKSWFYADTEQKAKDRITGFFEAKLLKIQKIDNPLLEIYEANKKKKEIKSNPLFKSL